MKWAGRSLAALTLLVALAGCGTMSDGGGSPAGRASSSPRVRCMSDPNRDYQSTSSPMFFLFCAESP